MDIGISVKVDHGLTSRGHTGATDMGDPTHYISSTRVRAGN